MIRLPTDQNRVCNSAPRVGGDDPIAKTADRYGMGKPSQVQKIDASAASLLCHEAAADARAAGWVEETPAYAFFA